MLLVITKTVDKTADCVLQRMDERNVSYLRLDSDRFGEDSVELHFSEVGRSVLTLKGRQIKLTDVQGVWLRRLVKPEMSVIDEVEARDFAEQELDFTLRWLIDSLSYRCTVLDREIDFLRGRNKLSQLETAVNLGLKIPATLITNNPIAAKDFVEKYREVAVKSVAGYSRQIHDGFYAAYTQKVTLEVLDKFDSIRLAPVCLQEYIEKAFELRVTIVGDKVFSCRIDSQHTERTQTDWRRYDDSTPYSAYDIDNGISNKLIKMMKFYNLLFASFDFVVTPDGQEIFLEMNPSSQFIWVERLTGMPITDAIIDELLFQCQK